MRYMYRANHPYILPGSLINVAQGASAQIPSRR